LFDLKKEILLITTLSINDQNMVMLS